MALTLITPPTLEPVTLEEAKLQCRIDGVEEDALLTALITTARAHVEDLTGLALAPQTWELVLDAFPQERLLEIPLAPLSEVIQVTYQTAGGQTLVMPASDYCVGTATLPGRLMLAPEKSWPGQALIPLDGVRVRFVCGYGDTPKPLRLAVKLLVGHWFENREEVNVGAGVSMAQIPAGVQALVGPYRVWRF